MNAADIHCANNWNGGFYELAFEVGPRSDAQLERVLSAVSRHARIDGCFRRSPVVPVARTLASFEEYGHLAGNVRLPFERTIVCGLYACRLDDGPDWLLFYLPLGALSEVESRVRGFPFDDHSGPESLEWRRPLDDWLVDIAQRVHREAAFRLALIGFDVLAEASADELASGVPDEREFAYVIDDGSGRLAVHHATR